MTKAKKKNGAEVDQYTTENRASAKQESKRGKIK